jgi:hypothetical protein
MILPVMKIMIITRSGALNRIYGLHPNMFIDSFSTNIRKKTVELSLCYIKFFLCSYFFIFLQKKMIESIDIKLLLWSNKQTCQYQKALLVTIYIKAL